VAVLDTSSLIIMIDIDECYEKYDKACIPDFSTHVERVFFRKFLKIPHSDTPAGVDA